MIMGEGTRVALDGARQSFVEHVEGLRLRLFRTALQASVHHASPVALAFAGHLDLSLDDILQVMGPPPLWPPASGALLPPPMRWAFPAHNGSKGGKPTTDRLHSRVLRAGGYVHRIGGGGDFVGWRVVGDAVESVMRLGEAAALTGRGTLRLWLPNGLPETIVLALPGRPLRALVDHPVLATGDWTIAAVEVCAGGGHVIRVRTGQRRFAAPWPALLARLMITHGGPSAATRYVREA